MSCNRGGRFVNPKSVSQLFDRSVLRSDVPRIRFHDLLHTHAALLIATKRLGSKPTPRAIEQRLKVTARDLGPPGNDRRYGFGALDAAAALGP